MPIPNDGETEKDFVARCIPIVLEDGTATDQEQAAAICYSKYREKDKKGVEAIKKGARHSAEDQRALQHVHDELIKLGAACPQPRGEVYEYALSDPQFMDSVVAFGSEIKALGITPEGVHLGGHLVMFGNQDQTDASYMRDFFTKDTDFDIEPGEEKEIPIYFHHRQPLKTREGGEIIIKRKVGKGKVKLDDIGVLIDAIIYNRDEYERALTSEAAVKRYGWSSGSAPHLIDRETQPNGSNWIKKWPIGGDASLTPTPAEPRIRVMSMKSYLEETTLPDTDDITLASLIAQVDALTELVAAKLQVNDEPNPISRTQDQD